MSNWPLVISPLELTQQLCEPDLLVVDVGKAETYAQAHLPGAVWLDFVTLNLSLPPSPGKLPPIEKLREGLAAIGLREDHHVVAYDDQGNGRAARLLWTLDLLGHNPGTLLDGGIAAWVNGDLPLDSEAPVINQSACSWDYSQDVVADKNYILSNLRNQNIQLLDCRSVEEYNGSKLRATRGGHIPGAVNLDWLDTKDTNNYGRFLPTTKLQALLFNTGIAKGKETIVYCQTHQRSSHMYWMLKNLNFPHVKGYPGSWSEWGNSADTPIEL